MSFDCRHLPNAIIVQEVELQVGVPVYILWLTTTVRYVIHEYNILKARLPIVLRQDGMQT